MLNIFGKKVAKLLLTATCMALIGGGQVFAAKAKNELVKEEEGFYYGYGKAATAEEADFMAKKDLIETALTSTLRLSNPKASRVSVSDDSVNARLTKLKDFKHNKAGNDVTYRIKVTEWEKEQKSFEDNLRASLTESYNTLTSGKDISARIESAVAILDSLSANGERDLLTLQAGGTELYSKKVEAVCSTIVENLNIAISAANGIIGPSTVFNITVKDANGKAVSGLKLKASWDLAELPVTTGWGEVDSSVTPVTTDKSGKAVVEYPVSDDFKNKVVTLTISTTFSDSKYIYSGLRKLDAQSSAEGRYIHYENPAEALKGVEVAAGSYQSGAVDQDTKAGGKEAARNVTLAAYEVQKTPVTNLQFAGFLFVTENEDYPAYFDNPTYNQAQQPVVGVTYEQAEAYAEWLSGQTGSKYRLPSDDEWEIAARAGASTIYPWGDDDPSKGKKANYKGNGKFKAPSPVGSFPDSTNAWGLVDMSGNVWEWTSSARNITDDVTTTHTVKGGSWMDGPSELRVSNYRNVDADSNSSDIGFRLVKEIK